jgi:hypothetical protein
MNSPNGTSPNQIPISLVTKIILNEINEQEEKFKMNYSPNHICICKCQCRDRKGFATLAPYRVGHSLSTNIFVCQHFASCKFSGKTCKTQNVQITK